MNLDLIIVDTGREVLILDRADGLLIINDLDPSRFGTYWFADIAAISASDLIADISIERLGGNHQINGEAFNSIGWN